MTLRLGFRPSLILSSLLLLATPALAAYRALDPGFQEGSWSGGAYSDSGGQVFEACVAQASFPDGLYVVFQLRRGGLLDLGLANDEWLIAPGARAAVTLRLEGGQSQAVQAVAQRGLFVLPLGQDPALLAALQGSAQIEVVGSAGRIAIELAATGGGRALARLEDCLRQQGG